MRPTLALMTIFVATSCSRLPGKTWCESHLIDWDFSDPQTREHLKEIGKLPPDDKD